MLIFFTLIAVFYYIAIPVLILLYEIIYPLVKFAEKLRTLVTLFKYKTVRFINGSWDILLKATYILLLLIIIVIGSFEMYFVTKTTNKKAEDIGADVVIVIKPNR